MQKSCTDGSKTLDFALTWFLAAKDPSAEPQMFISSALGPRDAGLVEGAALYRSTRLLLGLNIDESLELCSRVDGRVSWQVADSRPGRWDPAGEENSCTQGISRAPQIPGSQTAPAALAEQGMEGAEMFSFFGLF